MKTLVTGRSGWVGGYVVKALQKRGCEVVNDLDKEPESIIHLAWQGIPNYENPSHFKNVEWQSAFLRKAVGRGITNITITGTCLETLETLIPYSIAKLALRALAFELLPTTKWTRLWYLYGEGQRDSCLFPKLLKARDGEVFRVIDGERDFMEITKAADHICDIALQTKITGIIDCCSGIAESVESFCKKIAPNLNYKKDYPRPRYEPFSFHGNPDRLNEVPKFN